MIVHHGYSSHRGHYYSLVQRPSDNKWLKYDDEKVSYVEDAQKL